MNENSVHQRLRSHHAYLRLTAAAEALPGELERAKEQRLGHSAFLECLLEVEVVSTEARRRAGLERFACLPALSTSPTSTSTPSPRWTRPWSASSPPCAFWRTPPTSFSSALPGVGKTMLAVASGRASIEAGYRTYYATAADARCHRAALDGRGFFRSMVSMMGIRSGASHLMRDVRQTG